MIKRIISLTLATMVVVSTFITTTLFATSDLDTPFRPSDIPTGLVGYWKFNNDATDSSGSGYDLTAANSPTYTANGNYWKDAYATDLESSSSQYFSIAGASCPNLNFTSTFTLAAWVKLESTVSDKIIFGKWASNTGYYLSINAGTNVKLFFNSSTSVDLGSLSFSVGKWYHLVVIHNDTTNLMSVYVDGNLVGTVASTSNPTTNSNVFAIGQRGDNSDYFDGLISDAAAWSVALTPIQIKSLALGVDLSSYAYRPNNVSTQPTHWWKLNEVSGNRADSVSTNPLTLVQNGTVTSGGGYVEGVSAYLNSNGFTISNALCGTDMDFGTSAFSIHFRKKFISAADDTHYVMAKSDFGSSGWFVIMYPGATHSLSVWSAGSNIVTFSLGTALAANTPYDFVITRSGTTFKLYVDGIQTGGDQTSATAVNGSTDEFKLGHYGVTNYTEDVAIWKGYALTDAEIKSLACALPIQRQGIVSYWKMDETSGNRADSIGSNTLTDNNSVLYGTGKVSNAADFERDNSEYLSITDAAQSGLDLESSDMSIMTWLKPEAVDTGYLMGKFDGTNGYTAYVTGGGAIYFYAVGGTATSGAFTVTTGVWSFFCGVLDGYNRINYIDAVVKETDTSVVPANLSTAGNFNLGADTEGAVGNYFDGLLDETIVAKRYFRPEEIKAVYLKGINSKEVTSTELSPSATIRRILTVS